MTVKLYVWSLAVWLGAVVPGTRKAKTHMCCCAVVVFSCFFIMLFLCLFAVLSRGFWLLVPSLGAVCPGAWGGLSRGLGLVKHEGFVSPVIGTLKNLVKHEVPSLGTSSPALGPRVLRIPGFEVPGLGT